MTSEFYVHLYIRTNPDRRLEEEEKDGLLEKVKSAIGVYYDVVPNEEHKPGSSITVEIESTTEKTR